MAVKSGFFNSTETTGTDGSKTYDREYYAVDFANYLTKVVGNGVFATPSNNLQIVAGTGLNVVVKEGEGRIDGYWVKNDSDYTVTIDTPDVILDRIDRIVMQLNHDDREISIVYKKGTLATNPVAPALVRTEQIKEYSLARIYVGKNVTSIAQSAITDTRPLEDECGLIATMGVMESNNYFTQMQSFVDNFIATKSSEYETWEDAQQAAFTTWFNNIKETVTVTSLYREYQSVYRSNTENQQVITIPTSINYDNSGLDVLNVFINGMRLLKDVEYTISSDGTSITLTRPLDVANQDVEFVNKKSVSGTVAESVVTQVEKLQSEVDDLATCTYVATGTNDNIKLSNIVKAFLNGTGDYSSVADNASMKINVAGVMKTDTLIEDQMQFDFHSTAYSNRRVIIDFGNATIPVLPTSETGINILAIIGANSNVTIENAIIKIGNFNATTIYGIHGGVAKNCKIIINNQTATSVYGMWDGEEISNSRIEITSTATTVNGVYSTGRVVNNEIYHLSSTVGNSIVAGYAKILIGNIVNRTISTNPGVEIVNIGNLGVSYSGGE